jgi:hypothetical protein
MPTFDQLSEELVIAKTMFDDCQKQLDEMRRAKSISADKFENLWEEHNAARQMYNGVLKLLKEINEKTR